MRKPIDRSLSSWVKSILDSSISIDWPGGMFRFPAFRYGTVDTLLASVVLLYITDTI